MFFLDHLLQVIVLSSLLEFSPFDVVVCFREIVLDITTVYADESFLAVKEKYVQMYRKMGSIPKIVEIYRDK
jgi:hypothetical protein